MAEEEKKINWWKVILIIVLILGAGALGFYMGRKHFKETEEPKIEYITVDPIHDSIPYPVPYKVVEPIDTANVIIDCVKKGLYTEFFPERVITEYKEIDKTDTTRVMLDWATKRYYSETLFESDTLGKCKFDAEVQYNRLSVIGYEYEPTCKVVTNTVYKEKMFSPFLGAGFMINPWDEVKNTMLELNGGIFIKEAYGIQLKYQRAFQSKSDYVGGTFLYKF